LNRKVNSSIFYGNSSPAAKGVLGSSKSTITKFGRKRGRS